MENKEMIKVKRGNMLSNLWDDIFEFRLRKAHTRVQVQGHLGQHTNPLRQEKNKVMRENGFTGKQYRKYIKEQRRTIQ